MLKKIFLGLGVFILFIGLLIGVLLNTTKAVHVEYTFDAPIEKVWAVWTDVESMKRWWSPTGFTAPVIQSDFRVGGKFLLSMKSPDGQVSWNAGTYTEFIPQKKIVANMSFSDENGNTVPASHYGIPGTWDEVTVVTTEFIDLGGKTQVKIHETGIPAIMSVFAKMGWEQQFEKLKALL